MEVGEREIIYLSLHCHHQNDSCINKMGSDESHFNVSVGSDGHSHRTVSTKSKWYRTEVLPLTNPNALPLGQTGSHVKHQIYLLYMPKESGEPVWPSGKALGR